MNAVIICTLSIIVALSSVFWTSIPTSIRQDLNTIQVGKYCVEVVKGVTEANTRQDADQALKDLKSLQAYKEHLVQHAKSTIRVLESKQRELQTELDKTQTEIGKLAQTELDLRQERNRLELTLKEQQQTLQHEENRVSKETRELQKAATTLNNAAAIPTMLVLIFGICMGRAVCAFRRVLLWGLAIIGILVILPQIPIGLLVIISGVLGCAIWGYKTALMWGLGIIVGVVIILQIPTLGFIILLVVLGCGICGGMLGSTCTIIWCLGITALGVVINILLAGYVFHSQERALNEAKRKVSELQNHVSDLSNKISAIQGQIEGKKLEHARRHEEVSKIKSALVFQKASVEFWNLFLESTESAGELTLTLRKIVKMATKMQDWNILRSNGTRLFQASFLEAWEEVESAAKKSGSYYNMFLIE